MLTLSDVDALTEFFLKDGTTLMKQYADGKILITTKVVNHYMKLKKIIGIYMMKMGIK